VEKVSLAKTTRAGYQASERFFNIWYLMRYTPRRTRRRLTWLVEFMRLWFSADDLQRQAWHSLDQLRGAHIGDRPLDYALALSDGLPEDSEEHHLLKWSLYSTAHRRAGRVCKELATLLPDLFDAQETGHPLTTTEDYLRRFEALDEPLSRCPHATGAELRDWIAAVKGIFSLNLVEKERIAESAASLSEAEYQGLRRFFEQEIEDLSDDPGASDDVHRIRAAILAGDYFPDCPDPKVASQQILTAFGESPGAFKLATDRMAKQHHDSWTESLYHKSIELDPKDSQPWFSLGVLLQVHLKRPKEAEIAYRKSSELAPENPYPLANLGRLLVARGDAQEANTTYRQIEALAAKRAGDAVSICYADLILQT